MVAFGKDSIESGKIIRYLFNIASLFFVAILLKILSRRISGEKFNEIFKILPDNYLVFLYKLFIMIGLAGILWLLFVGLWVSAWATVVLYVSIIFVILGVFVKYLEKK
ncbi:MAG: hypothetical protein A2909_00115 [Candidatus Tagabacteria bacterium RIFCSPLOWO2_01_FULL_39_11]|uniref:Uncharacterized protein n=1 Tax=Candidatus Tagabacteria bacterium RIFCSPLOWO2_01_FULL_39_11 TaxID=1802295 RepID=A0A1G2LRM0_9BACT|nr:MAG: hypothetical protein A2909_00115 [Candidatus Tagabacteria bacterium RIFCSPLOWO2_01_FULL_39_11]